MTIASSFASTTVGRAAFERAVEEAARRDVRLVVVPDDRDEAASDDAEAIRWARELAATSRVELEVIRPEERRTAEDELLDLSFGGEVALLVLGVRRRSPVGKLVLGSMAQSLILEAGCDVLTVKPPVATRR